MLLGRIIQFIVLGQVLATGGVLRAVGWSWTYRSQLVPLGAITKLQYWTGFANVVLAPFLGQLNTLWINGVGSVFYPNNGFNTATPEAVNITGVVVDNRLSLNQAVYVNLQTALRTRPFNGSKRIGPVNSGDTAGDELTAAGAAAWTAALAPMTSTIPLPWPGGGTDLITPVVWSRGRSTITNFNGPAIGADLLSLHVNLTHSTWRHRRERVVR
jgi:hypothetical protein